ncbi:CHAT domain-containing protein [Candidatus Marithrix sp. Canyon 246]|uniref:CHAT domain-containing protein n=1 Tax=Candidatus Marithrix sp. Canyon 246 TaxID=1827136 RepID=UPI00084A0A13|nr:CHAT domain-containing protein [Candidatus Marithrix sp. Canyon 246]
MYQKLFILHICFISLTVNADNSTEIKKSLELTSLSDWHLLHRQLDKAKYYSKQSIDLACKVSQPLACATALNNQANILAIEGYYTDAIKIYQQSLTLATNSPVLYATILANILQIQTTTEVTFNQVLSHMQALPNSKEKIFGLLKLAYIAIETSSEQAYKILQTVKKIAPDNAYMKGYLGKLYEKNHRYQEAEYLTRQAIFLSDSAPEMLYLWQSQLGRLRNKQHDLMGAIKAYQQAVKHLQNIRQAILGGYRNPPQPRYENTDAVYFDLADLWLQYARTNPNKRQAALEKARQILELLKTVELENYFKDDCVTTLKPISIDNNTAVLYPMIFRDRVELLLNFSDNKIQQFTITTPQANQKHLRQLVNNFQEQLRNPNSNYRRLLINAQTLYDILIKKTVAELKKHHITTLIIIPDMLLRTIPFAALHDGNNFLISKYALAITPGLTLTDTPKKLKLKNINMLMAGLSKSVQGFAPLPNALNTIKAIEKQQLCPNIPYTSLTNQIFTTKNINNQLNKKDYKIVYFATHGKFEPNSNRSFLLTYDQKLNLNELEQLIKLNNDQPIELLILSACETAVGDTQAALGLAGIAIKAGARSAIASLWQVSETSTSKLMTAFYKQICNNTYISKALSFAKAQTTLMTQYKHPYYWAGFLLIGNWN